MAQDHQLSSTNRKVTVRGFIWQSKAFKFKHNEGEGLRDQASKQRPDFFVVPAGHTPFPFLCRSISSRACARDSLRQHARATLTVVGCFASRSLVRVIGPCLHSRATRSMRFVSAKPRSDDSAVRAVLNQTGKPSMLARWLTRLVDKGASSMGKPAVGDTMANC